MFWSKKNKEEHRYYLLPGMGHANREKRRHYFLWSLAVGIIISILFAGIIYFVNWGRYQMAP